MSCLTDKKIHEMSGHTIDKYNRYEESSHIENCNICSVKLKQYQLLDKTLDKGLLIEPPASITEFVMARILAKNPTLQSVILSILFSISTIVFLVFAYYGFAKDSLLKGLAATGNIFLNGLQSAVLSLSAFLDYSIVFVKTVNKFTKIVLGVGADAELIGLLFIVVITGMFFTFYKLASKVKFQKGV